MSFTPLVSPTGRLKQEAFRLCRSHGTKMDLLDRWIVPTDDHDILAKGLLDIALVSRRTGALQSLRRQALVRDPDGHLLLLGE